MDNLSFILHQIILPVIGLYSNSKFKFPNGSLTRQVLAYKILDIILILSLRIGPEQTRIEMEHTLKAYFDVFSLIRSRLQNFFSPHSRPLLQQPKRIETPKPISIPIKSTASNLISKHAFSRVGSYKSRNSVFARNQHHSKEFIQSFISSSELNESIENNNTNSSSDNIQPVNSYDDFLKYSYDQATNEIVSQQVRPNPPTGSKDRVYKYRSHSIGLLSLNDEEEPNAIKNNVESLEGSSEQERSASILEENEGLDLIIASPPTVLTAAASPKADDEIFATFNSSLAYTAYLNISRLNSGVYIDSILSNTDLIHQMCLQDEKKRQRMMMTSQRHTK